MKTIHRLAASIIPAGAAFHLGATAYTIFSLYHREFYRRHELAELRVWMAGLPVVLMTLAFLLVFLCRCDNGRVRLVFALLVSAFLFVVSAAFDGFSILPAILCTVAAVLVNENPAVGETA